MKILYVSHSVPYPLTDGFRVHLYHLLKELSRRHELHLVCFVFSPDEEQFAAAVRPFCRSTTLVLHHLPQQSWRRLWSMMTDPRPFCIEQYASAEMAAAVASLVRKTHPDLVQFDHTPMAQYERVLPADVARVFLPHDALSLLFRMNFARERHAARKVYLWNQFRKLRRFETRVLPRFDKTVVVSPVDQAVLHRGCPAAAIDWHPLGVDTEFFAEQRDRELSNVILFRGVMDFFPNHDAAQFFADEVLPLIWRQAPEAEFWIAGPKVLPSLQRRADGEPRIKVLGFVEDLREPMAAATVIVAPMRSGSGMKTKMVEALAMGKAIVATQASLPGLAIEDGHQLLIGDTPEMLAAHTLRLLRDAALRRKLGQAAREFAVRHHSWRAHAEFFERIYAEAVVGRVSAAQA
jgi:polysaccharide biosynthesis protein PslH